MTIKTTGPFGTHEKGDPGHVLNALVAAAVPVNIVDQLRFGKNEEILLNGVVFANYKYFPGIAKPLFRFQDEEYNAQGFLVEADGSLTAKFHLSLSVHGTADLVVAGVPATPELHDFLCGMLTNWTTDVRYEIHKAAGAFFQCGYGSPKGEYFYIEFWRPSGAEAFVDYINDNYVVPQNHKAIENV